MDYKFRLTFFNEIWTDWTGVVELNILTYPYSFETNCILRGLFLYCNEDWW